MKIAICDDHKIVADELIKLLKKYDELYEISYFEKPSLLYEFMKKDTVDLVFMDLEYEDNSEDGILWVKRINKEIPNIIFIILTAYEERYKEGYEVRAFRFMTKPIIEQELYDYMEAVKNELSLTTSIEIKRRGISYNVSVTDICYISAQAGGSEMWTRKDMFPSDESLLRWEEKLPMDVFFRCHSKYLVNMHYIESYEKQKILLISGEKIPVSRRRWREFQVAYMKYDTHSICN